MRASLARALLAPLLVVGSLAVAVADPAAAAGSYPKPEWVAREPSDTCFTGSTVDPGCSVAAPIATDFRLAGLAQMNAILAAQPELAQDESACPGAMWQRNVVVSRLDLTQFRATYRLPAGVTVGDIATTVPAGFHAITVAGTDAYGLITALYHGQLAGGPTASGVVSLAYLFTPAGAPRAASTPGTMPLPPGTQAVWRSPVALKQVRPMVVFDLDPAKVDVTVKDGWLDPVAGHGVFIRSLAESAFGVGKVPLVDVTDARALYSEGSIAQALSTYPMKAGTIASLSSGTYVCNVLGLEAPPLMLADAVRVLRTKGVHLVAAAGNDALSTYFYPAAYDEVLIPVSPGTGTCPFVVDPVNQLCRYDARSTVTAVGSVKTLPSALTTYRTPTAGSRSVFSNYGTWVKAWADGDQIVSSYVDGPFRYCVDAGKACDLGNGKTIPLSTAPTAHLGSTVVWSGTSFSAPMVAMWLAAGNPPPA